MVGLDRGRVDGRSIPRIKGRENDGDDDIRCMDKRLRSEHRIQRLGRNKGREGLLKESQKRVRGGGGGGWGGELKERDVR